MKRALYALIIIGFVFTSFQIANHYFRYELYDFAIEFESEKAGLTPKQTTLNGLDYYYLSRDISQAAETVILLHGFSANKENWLRFSQHIPNTFEIYAIDLLGHGQHPINLSLDYSITSQVDYLHHFITQYTQQAVHIVGNSMGGAIAALYAAKYPENVKTLMLISPAGIHDIPSQLDHALEQGSNPLIVNTAEEFYQVIDFVMEDQPFIPQSILAVQAEKSIKRMALNQKIFTDIRRDLDKKLDQNFSQIQAPTLILWGKEDRVINAENIHRYSTLISNSTPIVLNNIGHLAMIEAPKVAAQALITSLSTSKPLSN
tara:strand:- start:3442 stop:4392 length:951 start_codon:yes stop_codon:yes gene_type:complete